MVIFMVRRDQWQTLLEKLGQIAASAQGILAVEQENLKIQNAILKALTSSNRVATIRFAGGQTNMSLILPVNESDKFYLTLQDVAGNFLSALDPGETVTVNSSDEKTVVLVLDGTPVQDPDAGAPPTVASGTVAPATPPAAPNSPISVTATFTLTDGTVDATVSDTVTVTNEGGRKAGILFGTPQPLQSTAANTPPA